MKRDHPKWGPDIDRYTEIFDDRIEKAFDNYMTAQETTSVAHDGLLPLSVLETMLTVGENMHKIEYQHGDQSLSVLMNTVRRYTELNETGIFNYYYGYLCMRHIMRTICLGTLIESETLDDFLDNLDPALEPYEATEMLAEEAFAQMAETLFKNDLSQVSICLGCMPPKGDAFTHVGGLSYEDAEFLVLTLWKDRRSIIGLTDHGMLPGFPALLFTLSYMTIFSRASPQPTKNWTELKDIVLRFYIVATEEERKTMRQIVLSIHHNAISRYKLVGNYTTDEEDAREVVQAYTDIFRPLFDEGLAPMMMLDISNMLFQSVDSMLTPNLADCIPKVAWGGLERLWLEFDREKDGFMAAPQRGSTRRYASDIFCMVSEMRPQLKTPENEKAFDVMFLESDTLGLIGRVILLLSREGRNPDDWEYLHTGFEGICEAMSGPGDRALEQLAQPSATDWIKVQDQLDMLSMGVAPSKVPRKYLLDAIKVWRRFGPAPDQEIPCQICSNPRCYMAKVYIRPPSTNNVCGRCFKATYCSKRCQRVHWCLRGVDSHMTGCN
ncbi:hypothetical protein FRC12_003712 [Ceratobasidium sp. 428]|nr:hypothetical protein FRC12_003712 [Ceratobasidium sp. 428]